MSWTFRILKSYFITFILWYFLDFLLIILFEKVTFIKTSISENFWFEFVFQIKRNPLFSMIDWKRQFCWNMDFLFLFNLIFFKFQLFKCRKFLFWHFWIIWDLVRQLEKVFLRHSIHPRLKPTALKYNFRKFCGARYWCCSVFEELDILLTILMCQGRLSKLSWTLDIDIF